MGKDIRTQILECKSREDKRMLLKKLSAIAKTKIQLTDSSLRVNEVLIQMYSDETHKEFNSYKQWKEKGFIVKKGEKSFFVWSKKLNAKDSKEEDKEYKFFGMAHLFSNAQVEPLNK